MIARVYGIGQRGQGSLRVRYDGYGGAFDLVHFGGVDVDMDDTGARGKFAHLACHAIIETQPDADDQVSLSDGAVDLYGAVHTGHSQSERVGFGKGAQSQQSRDDRYAGFLGEGVEFRTGV